MAPRPGRRRVGLAPAAAGTATPPRASRPAVARTSRTASAAAPGRGSGGGLPFATSAPVAPTAAAATTKPATPTMAAAMLATTATGATLGLVTDPARTADCRHPRATPPRARAQRRPAAESGATSSGPRCCRRRPLPPGPRRWPWRQLGGRSGWRVRGTRRRGRWRRARGWLKRAAACQRSRLTCDKRACRAACTAQSRPAARGPAAARQWCGPRPCGRCPGREGTLPCPRAHPQRQ
mmetsp:Transcript_6611/g.27205  ORF Transcript_6611/g.27205 Transcript_6611/m.27205 type:complete len:237 (-) Transcript_6611:272-982(-)